MSAAPTYSLRRRLVWLLTSVVAAIWLLSVVVVYQRAHHQADELLDSQLTQVASTLLAIVAGGEVDHFVKELHEHTQRYPVPIAFEVWHTRQGEARRLVTSPGHAKFATGMKAGFTEHLYQNENWRFYTVQDNDAEYRVIVAQAHAARERLARDIGLSLLIPGMLALPMMALAVWWVVGRTLRPVDAVAHQVGSLDAQALAPLDASTSLPEEIAPLHAALNALILRVTKAFDSERRFTADAAHELRTPLAALKIQAQVAQRAQTADSQQRALAQVIAGVDRMTHLVEQLLTLARVDPASHTIPLPLDPAETIAMVCAALLPQSQRQGQTLIVDVESECQATVSTAWLQIAIRNLLDNAIRYAGEDARIEIRLVRKGPGCSISVADNGPGVEPEKRAHLTSRFVRGESETESEGCGLGLSIVSRIAQLSHARLELGEGLPRKDGGHGLAATLHFSEALDSR